MIIHFNFEIKYYMIFAQYRSTFTCAKYNVNPVKHQSHKAPRDLDKKEIKGTCHVCSKIDGTSFQLKIMVICPRTLPTGGP